MRTQLPQLQLHIRKKKPWVNNSSHLVANFDPIPTFEKGLECWKKPCMRKQWEACVSAAPCQTHTMFPLLPMPDTPALRGTSRHTGKPRHHSRWHTLFYRKLDPSTFCFPPLEHTAPKALSWEQNPAPLQTINPQALTCDPLEQKGTFLPWQALAFCDCSKNGPKYKGQANVLTTCLWNSLPYANV